MNGQTVYLDVDYAMEDGGGPITHLWLMDESGDNPDQTFVPEERAIAAETERDRLRELAAGIGHLLFSLDVDYCVACPRDGINHPCPVYTVAGGECLYKTDLRDLGVEVDDG